MITTTGTTIQSYLDWAKSEIEKKNFGEVSLVFTINNAKVVYVKKGSIDNDKIPLGKEE